MKLARSPPPPFAQPEQSRVANVTIPKSRVLALQVLRILRTKGFENFLIIFCTFFLRALSVIRVACAIARQSQLYQLKRAIDHRRSVTYQTEVDRVEARCIAIKRKSAGSMFDYYRSDTRRIRSSSVASFRV